MRCSAFLRNGWIAVYTHESEAMQTLTFRLPLPNITRDATGCVTLSAVSLVRRLPSFTGFGSFSLSGEGRR
jgi:hypothetical protein